MGARRPSHVRQQDRRTSGRPRAGEARPCPYCRAGSLVFTETYRWAGHVGPAWACENPECEYRQFVRALPAPVEIIKFSKAVQAGARRAAMKARAQTDRAKQQIASAHRVAAHHKAR